MTALAYALPLDDETEEQTEFAFDQLSDSAKDKARTDYRDGMLDHDWYESVYDDASTIAEMMGIDLDTKPVRLMSGDTRYDPAIYFSGFWSQGDGACFDGDWHPEKCPVLILDQVLAHAPEDEDLHEIALTFALLSERCALIPDASARVRQNGHYQHSGCTRIDVDLPMPDNVDENNELQLMVWNALCTRNGLDIETFETDITAALRAFMDWIYRQLESEHDYLTSDEQVDETIRANGYTFDEDGDIL